MKKIFCTLIVSLLLVAIKSASASDSCVVHNRLNDSYYELQLSNKGLHRNIYDLAIKGFQKLNVDGKLQNANVITIVDYSQSSNQKRLYVIDMKNNKLLFNTLVAHGRNNGDEFAESFSNSNGSYKSSLGFFITRKTITGGHTGFALSLDGVEKGFNDNARKRAIIMHAADYVSETFIKKYGRLGRSLGCPALPPDFNKPIIETIKDGSCLFLYNPDPIYICESRLLN